MEINDPVREVEYLECLAAAVHNGVRYGIAILAVGEERAGDVPLALTIQARCAARHRVPLETTLRRYLAAEKLLADFALEEAADLDPCQVRTALGSLTAAAERIVATASEEYVREQRVRPASHEARLVERARRLLAGELVDPLLLKYDLGAHHLGLVAYSAGARDLVRDLARAHDYRSLILSPSPEELWAWLGSGREPIDAAAVLEFLVANGSPEHPIGVGEAKSGSSGWRLTHKQAKTAVWVAEAKTEPAVEYSSVSLLASIAGDPLLMTSLYERYILPLAIGRDGGEALRQNLRAYFACDRNANSAAAILGVSRQTVASRLRQVELCVGEPLSHCGHALEAALGLEEIGCFSRPALAGAKTSSRRS